MKNRVTAGDLEIDTEARRIHKNGKLINLSDLSFATLLELVTHAPASVTNEQLSANVWNSDHVSAETIAQRVKIVRRALHDDSKAPRYIRTIRNQGYAFIAPIAESQIQSTVPAIAKRLGFAALVILAMTVALSLLAPGLKKEPAFTIAGPPAETDQIIGRAHDLTSVHQPAQTDEAIRLLQTTLLANPDQVNLLVPLSFALSTRYTKFNARKDDSIRAEQFARQAIRIDSDDGSAWHALAYSLDAQGRVDEAINAYQIAYELNPHDVSAMSSAAYLLQIRGRIYDALVLETDAMKVASGRYSRFADIQIALSLELLRHHGADAWRTRAQRIAPDHVVVLAEVASAHLRNADPDAAQSLLNDYSDNNTQSPRLTRLLGRAALMKGDKVRARELFEFAGFRSTSDLIALDAMDGDRHAAVDRIAELAASMLEGDSWPETRIQMAELHAVLGNHEAAIECVSQAIDLGWLDIGLLRHSPFLATTRQLETWEQLEYRIGSQIQMQRRLIDQSKTLQVMLSI